LKRSAHVLSHDEPFASLGGERRAALIHEQSVIVEFEKDLAIDALARLLPEAAERLKAVSVVEFVAGALEEMEPQRSKPCSAFGACSACRCSKCARRTPVLWLRPP